MSPLPWLLLAACTGRGPTVEPADREALRAALTFPLALTAPTAPVAGSPQPTPGATVTPLRLDLAPGLSVGAALWIPDTPTGAGVVVAHGHFGQGKSAPETQEIAHRLAARGALVLAVDTPGTEEQARTDNEIHLEPGGPHGRGVLRAAGTNAMALQVALLRVGLDLLAARGATRLGATGASGGAVQAFYLGVQDPRVRAVALAAFPPVPREARPGGCACDQVPGFPGPDPGVVALLEVPSLWMGDGARLEPPAGLGPAGRFVHFDAPHTYAPAMQDAAVDFFADALDLRGGPRLDRVPGLDLAAPAPAPDALGLRDLALPPPPRSWTAGAADPLLAPHTLSCEGRGPTVLVLGGTPDDLGPLAATGRQACLVDVREAPGAQAETIAEEQTFADAVVASVRQAADRKGATAVVARRAWALPASALGVPYAVVDPVRHPRVLTDADPEWVHVPGVWHGGMSRALGGAVSVSADLATAAAALPPADQRRVP